MEAQVNEASSLMKARKRICNRPCGLAGARSRYGNAVGGCHRRPTPNGLDSV